MTPSQRQKRATQRRARRKLQRVLAIHGRQCHWCQSPVVCVASIPKKDRIEVGKKLATFRENGETKRILIATIDHLIPLSKNGTNDLSNLVPACMPCNNGRQPDRPWRLNGTRCKECKKVCKLYDGFCFHHHHEDRKEKILTASGWVIAERRSVTGLKMWVSPDTGKIHEQRWALWCIRKYGKDLPETGRR